MLCTAKNSGIMSFKRVNFMVYEVYLNKTVTKKKYGFYLTSTQQLPDLSPMHPSLILQTHLEGLVQLSRIGSWADSRGCPQPHPQHQWSLDAFLNCQLVLEAASSPRNQDASQERVVSDGGKGEG